MSTTSFDRTKYLIAAERQRRERELTKDPIPERITSALDLRELYGPEVDRACGVEESTVDQWEAGEVVPTREQVEALAKLTRFPVTFFYMPITVSIGPMFICGEDGCEFHDPNPRSEQPVTNVVAFPVQHPEEAS